MRLFARSLAAVSLLALSSLVAGCGDSTTAPSGAPFSKTELVVGTGAEAVAGKKLTMIYSGWLWDASKPEQKGVLFDTSVGRDPLVFTLGAGQVISGWDQGVPGMKVGGKRRLVLPPSLAYGSSRVGIIPPNATLVFDIELLKVEEPE